MLSSPPTPALRPHSAFLLQVAIVLTGIGALGFLLWEPQVEGRNAHATLFEIYFKDPFLAYVYIGSTPFFVALYRAFGLFGHVRETRAFAPGAVDALRVITRCAFVLMGFVAGGVVFILMFGDKEDRPAGVFMSLLVMLGASGIAIAATVFARNLKSTLGRSEGLPH